MTQKNSKNILNQSENTWYNEAETEERDHYTIADSAYETFWQNLTITDDFMFGKIMSDATLCTELLRRIFPAYDIERIEYINSQQTLQPLKDAKGIRLDVFVRDNKNVAFCVEMQTRNADNLPKRSRYYQSLVDMELLDRGQAYDELSKSYVVFICPFDIFHMGRHIYEFRNYCKQDKALELGDEAAKIFLNAKGTQGDITPQLKEFLDYVAGKESDTPSEFIVKLKDALSDAKLNKRWRRERMILYLRDQDIRADALKEGRKLGHAEGCDLTRREIVRGMIDNGVNRELICRSASITEEELEKILREISEG